MDSFTKVASSDTRVFRWAKSCPHLRRKWDLISPISAVMCFHAQTARFSGFDYQ